MKTIHLALSALLVGLLSSNINAASIQVETRHFGDTSNSNNLVPSWNSQTSAISTTSISEFTSYTPGKNTINRLTAEFSTGSAGTWGFQAGLDAHYGAELYLDGSLIGDRVDDLWWAYNWNSSDVFSALSNSLSAGAHSLELYWAEACCNGASSMRFTTDGSSWQSLSTENLAAASPARPQAVPEALPVLLVSLGLVGFMLNHRKQQALMA